MPVEITVPQLGESVVEATVGAWRKRAGERVDAGEVVVELETDKVNLEVAAPEAGMLASIAHAEGDTVGVGDVLATIGDSASAPAPSAASASEEAPSAAATAEATPASGAGGQSSDRPQLPAARQPAAQLSDAEAVAAHATPLARRIAEEHGLDLREIHGTGPGGRVTHDDVSALLAPKKATPQMPPQAPHTAPATGNGAVASAPAPASATAATPSGGGGRGAGATRPEERVRLSRRRQTIARRLVEAQHAAAMLTTFNEVDMSAIMELRKRRRDAFKERHGVGLGFMSFFTRAVVGALKAYPRLNAEIQGDEMVLKRYYDIGIAVSTDEGLVVPVVRDADRLSFAEIERQIAALAEKARNRALSLEDLQGGTFTITNGGVFVSLLSTPILNGPQVGILGMHKIEERPIALNGQVVIRPMMYVAVSYDHRIVDGAESVSFLVRVKELLEDPEALLLEG